MHVLIKRVWLFVLEVMLYIGMVPLTLAVDWKELLIIEIFNNAAV